MTVIDLRDRSWRVRGAAKDAPRRAPEELGYVGRADAGGRGIEAGWRAIGLDAAGSGLAAIACGLWVPGLTVGMLIGLLLAWPIALSSSRAYASSVRDQAGSRVRRVLAASVRLLAVVAVLAAFVGVSLAPLVTTTMALTLVTVAGRLLLLRGTPTAGSTRHPYSVVIRGSAQDVTRLLALVGSDSAVPFTIVGVQVVDGGQLPPEMEGKYRVLPADDAPVDAALECGAAGVVFVGMHGDPSEAVRRSIWQLEGAGLRAQMMPILAPLATPSVESAGRTGLPLLSYDCRDLGSEVGFSKVVVDKLVALAGILALAPVLVVIGASVKLTSRGPILFRQVRVGRSGSQFQMLKFRTMYQDAEARRAELVALNEHEGGTLFKIRNDPRVTTVGRVLRKYSLDELPQLINVVRGEMSLVGPRPPLPDEVRHYAPDSHRRFRVRPGLTGLWQVSGRSDLDPVESARLDTHYVEHWSIGMDLTILARTPKVVVTGEGAY